MQYIYIIGWYTLLIAVIGDLLVRSYTRSLNAELKAKGIVCTAVCPGWIDTDMLQKEYNGKPVKFPGLVFPERVAVQAMHGSAKGKDMSVCSLFVKYEHFLRYGTRYGTSKLYVYRTSGKETRKSQMKKDKSKYTGDMMLCTDL